MMKCYFPDIPKNPNDLRAFVEAEDKRFASEVKSLSDRVAASPKLKILGLTGPTCSGKTTAAKRLTASLEAVGHRVHTVSLDDFYHDKDVLQKRADENPDIEIDYDSEDTIDVALLEEKTRSLLSGLPTQMPRFDFQLGYRCEGELLDSEEGDVYVFEGIQLLYPKVYAAYGAYAALEERLQAVDDLGCVYTMEDPFALQCRVTDAGLPVWELNLLQTIFVEDGQPRQWVRFTVPGTGFSLTLRTNGEVRQ